MPLILLLLYLALAVAQVQAFLHGMELWLGVPWALSLVIGLIGYGLPFGPLVCSAIAFYGAYKGWQWEWWQAALLTFPSAIFNLVFVGTSGVLAFVTQAYAKVAAWCAARKSITPHENVSSGSSDVGIGLLPKDFQTDAGYFARHWRGELSLPVSYWLNGFIVTVSLTVFFVIMASSINLKDDYNPAMALSVTIGAWALSLFVYSWQTVGIWRSANRYKQSKRFWGTAAQVFVVLGILRTLGDFSAHGAPQIGELVSIYMGDRRVGEHTFKVQQDGQVLEFSGGITFGAARDFALLLDATPSVKLVSLQSKGGRVVEAQRISDIIRSRGLDTYVPNQCASACTLIFLAGRNRLVGTQGGLGFHQSDFPGWSEVNRRSAQEEQRKLLVRAGVSNTFASKALRTPPNEIWFPTAAELINNGVATRIVRSVELVPAPQRRVDADGGGGMPQKNIPALNATAQGNGDSETMRGDSYYFGQGVAQNYAEAVKWYRFAADQGGAKAQYNLGVMYENGQGVPPPGRRPGPH